VIAHQVGVFGQIDGFEGEFAEAVFAFTFSLLGAGDAASAEFGAYTVLTVHHGWMLVGLLMSICYGNRRV